MPAEGTSIISKAPKTYTTTKKKKVVVEEGGGGTGMGGSVGGPGSGADEGEFAG